MGSGTVEEAVGRQREVRREPRVVPEVGDRAAVAAEDHGVKAGRGSAEVPGWLRLGLWLRLIFRLCARKLLPVSVFTTMASTRSGTFTSQAPQENSTCADTLCFARYRSVKRTYSVAMRRPARS